MHNTDVNNDLTHIHAHYWMEIQHAKHTDHAADAIRLTQAHYHISAYFNRHTTD